MKKLILILILGVTVSCSDDEPADPGPDATEDTGEDAGVDPEPDGEEDAGLDTGTDSQVDPREDAPSDGDPALDLDHDGGTVERPNSALFGQIIFNEVLIDGTAESNPDGNRDANGDGDAHSVDDQFVELVNVHDSAIDMGSFTLLESHLTELVRHTFADGFTLDAGDAVVVFGGGDAPDATDSATFFVANAADPGLPFGLHLYNTTDDMLLLDDEGAIVARFCYGAAEEPCELEPAADSSLTRSPDLTGDFVSHVEVEAAEEAAFSPGTRLDGTIF